jgi:hypothetical protein
VHKEFWEDIEDVLVSQSRQHEKCIPFENVNSDFIKSGKLRGSLPALRSAKAQKRTKPASRFSDGAYLRGHRETGG